MSIKESQQKILYYPGFPALAYKDVFLYPAHSDITSRHNGEINTSSIIARGAPLVNIPLISAGMDTVTEDHMAITMALAGGIGEIHRNNTPSVQAELVRRVKDHMKVVEDHPPILSENTTIREAQEFMLRRGRGYSIVSAYDHFDGTFIGMVTTRDLLAGESDQSISAIMTPLFPRDSSGKSLITVPIGTTLEQAVMIMRQRRVEKIPIVDSEGRLVGVYTLQDHKKITSHPLAAIDADGRLLVAGAIGVKKIDIDRAHALVDAGVDILIVDIAHGDHEYSAKMMEALRRENIAAPVVLGNVATKNGVKNLARLGPAGIKVGIGPGFVCTTRNVAGTGVPQITAILEARDAVGNMREPPAIIADGGVREVGDPAKAIAAGADIVMIGSNFAGTTESPGEPVISGGILVKSVRGMASEQVAYDRSQMEDSTTNMQTYVPEGRKTETPFKGSVLPVLKEYVGGLRSAMSYSGSHTIEQLQKAQLIYVSDHGSNENTRDLSK